MFIFSSTIVQENTMNLSKRSRDKELFFETQVKENIYFIYLLLFLIKIIIIFIIKYFILL